MISVVEIDDRIAKCEKLLASDPKSQIFAALAEAYRKKGDIEKARDICLDGLKIHPDYSSARVVLAKILMELENYDSAWEELTKAIAQSGRTRSIDILEAEILLHRGQKFAALAILQRLHASDPENENIKNLIGQSEGLTHAGEFDPGRFTQKNTTRVIKPEEKSLSIGDVISVLKAFPKVNGAIAIGKDGLIIECYLDVKITKEELGAFSKLIFDSVHTALGRTALGKPNDILIETSMSKLLIFFRNDILLAIISRPDVNLGALKFRIDDLIKNVKFISEGDTV